jgi:hypothetical protein
VNGGRHRVAALARRVGALPQCRIVDFFFVTFLLFRKVCWTPKTKIKKVGPKTNLSKEKINYVYFL